MYCSPKKITIKEWDKLYNKIDMNTIKKYNLYKLSAFAKEGDKRLNSLKFDNDIASLCLWNFLLTEEDRLFNAQKKGKKIIGVMKDLGTIPVIVFSLKNAVAFYPEGCWWTPCFMEMSDELLQMANREGIGEDACPARATLSAFIDGSYFPIPEVCIAAVGSCCDDFSAIMQRISGLGHRFLWWELPYRKDNKKWYKNKPKVYTDLVIEELYKIIRCLEDITGEKLTQRKLTRGIKKANYIRSIIRELRNLSYSNQPVPYPALEMLICEAISIHFCSDLDKAEEILSNVLNVVKQRVRRKDGIGSNNPYRIMWVNPVSDVKMLHLFEELGGCIAGTDYIFSHAFMQIREDIDPLSALAECIMSDNMIGSSYYRAESIVREAIKYNAEGIIISKIPGASHCIYESEIIMDLVQKKLNIPVLEVTVPPLIDQVIPAIKTRLQAFFEVLEGRRRI